MKKLVAATSLVFFSAISTVNPVYSVSTKYVKNDVDLKAHKKYAIIMTGGDEQDLYDKTEGVYNRMQNLGLNDEDIEYLASNKDKAKTQGLESKIDSGNNWLDVRKAFDKIDKKMTEDDVLFVFYIGHGAKIKSNNPNYKNKTMLTNYLTEGDLDRYLDNIDYKAAIVFIDACHSGAFTSIAEDNRIVMSSCKTKEKSFLYADVAEYFVKALSKKKDSKRADTNKDGKVTVKEAFKYAKQKDFWSVDDEVTPKALFPKPQMGTDKLDPDDVYVKYK